MTSERDAATEEIFSGGRFRTKDTSDILRKKVSKGTNLNWKPDWRVGLWGRAGPGLQRNLKSKNFAKKLFNFLWLRSVFGTKYFSRELAPASLA